MLIGMKKAREALPRAPILPASPAKKPGRSVRY